jgi:NAD(P)-dependent dehydrogenase (short-subunit alcohol dehydrogenase family)
MADEFNPFSLRGKTILVTGASSGIGRGIAITCSRMGASVYITGRNKSKLDETLSLMSGSNNYIITADLTVEEEREYLVSELPSVDGVIHNAGVGCTVLCKNITDKDFMRVIHTNLEAPILLQSSLLINKKINKGSSLVFIASIGSQMPIIGNAIYSASKGGIISYAKCLGLELAPRKVRVNCICPAMVRTELVDNLSCTGIDSVILKEDELKYPLKRYGRPEDIANLAVYLLSDASNWMTGSVIEITGGERTLV